MPEPVAEQDLPEELYNEILNPVRRSEFVFRELRIREDWTHFEVEEVPLYLPDGSGDHLYLWIEKRGLTTGYMVEQLSRCLGVSIRDIGVAGQKDRHAVTRQWVSVPRSSESRLPEIQLPGVEILKVDAHRNKLKTGHLRGNRFRLIVSPSSVELDDSLVQRAQLRMQELEQKGFPSYYGSQRFGHQGSTIREGLGLLTGQRSLRTSGGGKSFSRLALNAVQSAHFNLVTAERVRNHSIDTVLPGDVVIRKGGTRPYLHDPDQTSDRSHQLIPAGPMWGPKMVSASGPVYEAECMALGRLGLQGDEFLKFKSLCEGARRPMLEFPVDGSVSRLEDSTPAGSVSSLLLTFELNAGMYATTLLREFAEHVQGASIQ